MLLQFGVLGLIFILLERYAVRRALRFLRKTGYNQKYMVIVGAGNIGANFARKVSEHKDFGYNVKGFLDDERNQGELIMDKPVLGKCSLLPELLTDNLIDEVVVASSLCISQITVLSRCVKTRCKGSIIPDYMNFSGQP
jgi:FlaA1/EpsC-like NDP-sugar epimerase